MMKSDGDFKGLRSDESTNEVSKMNMNRNTSIDNQIVNRDSLVNPFNVES